jgi:chemotaxis protein methyltransferase CheR
MLNESTALPAVSAAELEALRGAIKRHCGLRLEGYKLEFALQRAWPALSACGLTDARALLAALGADAAPAWPVLLPFLTINETYFMRERQQLEVFAERALPELRQRAARRGEAALSLLSAACSTGEEAYTLAMLLADRGVRGRLTGIDIDPAAIARAEAGVYGPNAFRGVDPAWREARFEAAGPGAWSIREPYRGLATFKRMNLLTVEAGLAGRRFDAIFCRNVLIYFERATQLAVIRQLGGLLHPGGYLMLGHSEMFFGVDLDLEVVATDGATLYRRKEVT